MKNKYNNHLFLHHLKKIIFFHFFMVDLINNFNITINYIKINYYLNYYIHRIDL